MINMDFVLVLFIAIVLLSIKFGFNNKNESFDKDVSLSLKGLLAFIIIFHHIQPGRTYLSLFNIFRYLGNFCSALFFFISGYGLMKNFNMTTDKDKYYMNYKKNHFIKLPVKYIIISICYYIISFILFGGLYKNNVISPHSWYIIDIIILYVIFYFISRNVKNKIEPYLFLSILLLNIVFILLKFSEVYYISIFSFFTGMVYLKYENKKNNKYSIICIIGIFLTTYILQYFLDDLLPINFFTTFFISMLKNIAGLTFSIIIIIKLCKYINFRNNIFKFCGRISLEMYLIHGILEMIFSNIYIINNNNFVYGFLIIISTIILSYLFNSIFGKILKGRN